MKSKVMKRSGLLLAMALATAACSRETPAADGAFTAELKAPPAPRTPVARVGVPDDGVKPAPLPITKGGVPDDSVKPVARGGVPDDSVKPRPVAPLPTPAPR